MERSIRIGKDFNVRWSINKVVDGERQPYELAGKELVLQYRTPYGLKEATEWKVVGNTIVWTFRGKEQKALGSYELVLTENGGKDGMVTVDTCRAFKLVAHSCEETEGSGSDIVIEDVVLESEVTFAALRGPQGEQGPAGPSYDDTEIKGKLAELSAEKEDKSNKTTTLSSASTDTQYPSAKAVFTAIGKKSKVSLETLANGNLKVIIDGVSKDFMPATPSGDPMHYAYIEAGAEYDEETKLWRYGGKDVYNEYRYIEGLTTKEVADAYKCMPSFAQITPIKGQWSNSVFRPRFVFCMLSKSGIAIDAAFQENTSLEFVDFRRDVVWISAIYAFYGCTNLHTIHQRIYLKGATAQNVFLSTFQGCKNLQNIKLFQLVKSIDFKDSSLLTNASILYMVSNSATSSAIVITLHADAYARAMADAEILAALEAHPNVSLASA